MTAIIDLFGLKGFIPHGYCLLWSPALLWLHAASDFLIFLAYFSIPLALIYFIKQRKEIPYPRLFFMFAGFITIVISSLVVIRFLESSILYIF